MLAPPVIQQLLARIPDHALCGQNSGITSQEKLATVHSTTPASGGAVGGGMPLTGSILTDDAVLNDLQPGEKQAYNSVKSTQVDELFDVVTKFSAEEFLKTALANTIHANSANVQVQPQSQLATKPVQQQTPAQIPNPSAINGLHQTMQQLMPGAANPTQGMPLLAPSPAPGALSQPGLSGGQGGKATAIPGLAGQSATNVIDQQGALDASGSTVDGNHSSLVSKAAAAGGIGNMLQSLGYKAVNNNQRPQTVQSDGKSYSLQDLMNHASGRLPAGESPDSLDIVEAMMSLDAAKQKQAVALKPPAVLTNPPKVQVDNRTIMDHARRQLPAGFSKLFPKPKPVVPPGPPVRLPVPVKGPNPLMQNPAPAVPKPATPASPPAVPQGRYIDPSRTAPPAGKWGYTVPTNLGDNIERYYGGRPGLDKAVADAQAWQAKREPGTMLDAFPKMTPESINRNVPVEYGYNPNNDVSGTATFHPANAANNGYGERMGNPQRIMTNAYGNDTRAKSIEPALTQAAIGAYDRKNTQFSDRYPMAADKRYLSGHTSPAQMDPGLAGIKRLYTSLTGENVNTPEAAARALDFAANPQLKAFEGKPQADPFSTDQNAVRPLEDQFKDQIDPGVLEYINQTPEVRDTAIRRLLELVQSRDNATGVAKTASTAVYGYCPKCGAPGETRERRINGDDTCENGHKYPSRDALKQQKTAGKA